MLLVSCGDVKPLGRTVMEGFNAILGDVQCSITILGELFRSVFLDLRIQQRRNLLYAQKFEVRKQISKKVLKCISKLDKELQYAVIDGLEKGGDYLVKAINNLDDDAAELFVKTASKQSDEFLF